MMKTKLLLMLAAVSLAVFLMAGSASAKLLVYEPFDYPDAALNGNGGALGTTGTWITNDTGEAQGWWCHPEGEVTGQGDDLGPGGAALNLFDGTVENLATTGGFAGPAGPTDQSTPGTWGTRDPTGNLDANIGLDPSVTATFQSGTTTWFSYVGCHADNRNQGSPTFMICTDPTTNGSRGLTMQNSGNGIGGVGGPPRFNLYDVYPHYFRGGVHNQTPGGYGGGVLGDHNGIVTAFCSTGTCDGVLGADATRDWAVRDADGYMGVPNIVVGKIEWDADTGGYDIISVVSFLETDELTEAAFDAIIAAKPLLSSKNWPAAVTPADPLNPSNKPNLDQSQFDLINISSLKFWVDEIRIGTTFNDVIGASGAKDPSPADGATVPTGNVDLSWTNADPNAPGDDVYVDVWFGTEPNELHPGYDMTQVVTAGENITTVQVSAPTEGTYYWQVNSYIYGADHINEPNMIEGFLWSFNAVDDAPPSLVDAGVDMITWSGQAVSLDATVVDDGASALTYLWTADPADGVEFVPSAAVEDPTVTINKSEIPITVTRSIQVENDDAEEYLNTETYNGGWGGVYAQGNVSLDSSDLEVGDDDGGTGEFWQVVALQYDQLGIPKGATINSAKITFQVDEVGYGIGNNNDFTILAEAADNASVFIGEPNNITKRARSTASVAWNPPATPTVGVKVDTPDISSLIQEVVDRPGWSEDNRLTLMIYPDVYLALPDPLTGGPGPVTSSVFEAGPGDDSATLTVRFLSSESEGPPVTVELTLAVHDEGNPTPVEDTMEIDVYDDACQAAIGAGLDPIGPADFDSNCITDLRDYAVFAAKWLVDRALTAPVAKP